MNKSIAMATMLVVGAGATGASALPNPYQGADALYDLTQAAITNIGTIGRATYYVGGGSANGLAAMAAAGGAVAAATQQTAPMSKMIGNAGSVCKFNNDGTGKGANDTHASVGVRPTPS